MIGDGIMIGGGGGSSTIELLGVACGSGSGQTVVTMGSNSSVNVAYSNSEYFTHNGGVLTCVQGGTYKVYYWARGGRGSNAERQCTWTLYKNSSSIGTGNAKLAGASGYYDVSFNTDDTVHITCASVNTAGNGGYFTCGMAITI